MGRGSPTFNTRHGGFLKPIDDQPPVTIVTGIARDDDSLIVTGTTEDDGPVAKVTVNGRPATPTADNYAQWQAHVAAAATVVAAATDAAGNAELAPHTVRFSR